MLKDNTKMMCLKTITHIFKAPKGPITQIYLQRNKVTETSQWRPSGETVQVGATHVLEEFGFIWLKTLELCKQHILVDEWQNAGASLFPVSVPCVHPPPSVSCCHMTGRCVSVINPQITTHWETEFCHSSPQAEQNGTGKCYLWQDCLRMYDLRDFKEVLVCYYSTQW